MIKNIWFAITAFLQASWIMWLFIALFILSYIIGRFEMSLFPYSNIIMNDWILRHVFRILLGFWTFVSLYFLHIIINLLLAASVDICKNTKTNYTYKKFKDFKERYNKGIKK